MAYLETSTGSSSIELSKTSKGEYSYSIKLYFTGSAVSSIKRVVKNLDEARIDLENMILRAKEGVTEDIDIELIERKLPEKK